MVSGSCGSQGIPTSEAQLADDLKRPFSEVFLREFHKSKAASRYNSYLGSPARSRSVPQCRGVHCIRIPVFGMKDGLYLVDRNNIYAAFTR